MKKLTILILLVTLLLLPFNSYSAFKKLGQAGCTFLNVAMGARASAMAGAYTVMGDDANAILYNPGGLGLMQSKFDLSVNVTKWITNISYNNAILAINGGVWGNFGINVSYADYGEVEGTLVSSTDPAGYIDVGLLDVNSYIIGISYARKLTGKFTSGAQFKYISQRLGSNIYNTDDVWEDDAVPNEVSGLAYDFGLIFFPEFSKFKSFGLGMSVRNFSPEYHFMLGDSAQARGKSFQLPLNLTIGVAIDLFDILGNVNPNQSVMLAVDVIHPRDYTERVLVGAEYNYKDFLMLRLGYKFNYDEEGLCAGVGVHYKGVKIDYSYCELGMFDLVNRVSCGVSF
jgi:hypothetical protein